LGYFEAKERFGSPSVSWASLVQPTINLCESGVPMTGSLLQALEIKRDRTMRDKGMV
jgi:gamma-glutamyltranspeptidase